MIREGGPGLFGHGVSRPADSVGDLPERSSDRGDPPRPAVDEMAASEVPARVTVEGHRAELVGGNMVVEQDDGNAALGQLSQSRGDAVHRRDQQPADV